jgi:hypothetical protein
LEVMTITNNDMVFTLDNDEELLHLEFETIDDRARYYSIELYNDPADHEIIGEVNKVSFDSESRIIVDIPFEDIEFIGDYDISDISDIKGIHVVLFDQATVSTQLEVESEWFNYMGYSEFITLAP